MANTSENSFGAKLQNAKKFYTFLQSLTKYQPANPDDSIEDYQKLIAKCDVSNTEIATNLREYSMAVDKRTKAFTGKENTSLNKLLSPITQAIAGQYGKTSKEYSSTINIINKMRPPKTERGVIAFTEEKKENISRTELSYGSKLQNLKDLIATLTVFQNYAPINPDIRLEKLNELVKELEYLNTEVNAKTAPLNVSRSQRTSLFDDLSKRTQRIKANISSLYGNNSAEYKQIKGLKV